MLALTFVTWRQTMSTFPVRPLILLSAFELSLVSCTDRSPVAPTDTSPLLVESRQLQSNSNPPDRPIKGSCATAFTFIDPSSAGQCAVFQQVPSAFVAIDGRCEIAHLGRTELDAIQQLVFQLDATGQPVIVGGQPVVTQLRNCSTLSAANGDELTHTTIGDVMGTGPGQVAFSGWMTFVGGTGRFSAASGSATFSGTADLITSTGAFSFEGTVVY
jgi:hypothetical protein